MRAIHAHVNGLHPFTAAWILTSKHPPLSTSLPPFLAFHHATRTPHSFSLHPHLNLSITAPHRWVRREPDSDLWQLQPQVAWIICLLVSAVSPAFLQSVLLQDAFTVEKSPVCFQTKKHFRDRLWWWHGQLVLIFESGPAGITFLLIYESADTKSCQNPPQHIQQGFLQI